MKPSGTNCQRFWLRAGLLFVAIAALTGGMAWYKFYREEPQSFDSPEEAYKYGSIGTEAENGLPYWVWLVLPRVFSDYLPGPGGYTSLGIVWEEGHETPVGFSKKTIGFPRIGINCALCHSGTYRTAWNQAPTIVPTAPATRLNPLEYQRFLFKCAADERFSADNLLPAIEYNIKLSPLDKLLYRYVIIPATRKALLRARDGFAWTSSRPDWGRGRIDPFNPVKFGLLKMPSEGDRSIGNSDMEPLWNQAARAGFALHWDGLDDNLTEVVLTGALGDGATPASLPVQHLKKIELWLKNVQPPAYPFSIEWKLVPTGRQIFQAKCAECHQFGGEKTGKVIPIGELLTDAHRLEMWTQDAADRYNKYAASYPWKFNHFRKLDGFVAVSLDGIWLRAPYLHNGSVPTLTDLLEPAERRPKTFYRGCDVYDPVRVGFLHDKKTILQQQIAAQPNDEAYAAALRKEFDGLYFYYDTSLPGNANSGHEGEKYGTTLKPDEKKALLEFLKTQ